MSQSAGGHSPALRPGCARPSLTRLVPIRPKRTGKPPGLGYNRYMMGTQVLHNSVQRWRLGAWVVFVLVVLIGALTVSDYGMTWDEHFRFQGGDSKLTYYQDLLAHEDPGVRTSSYPGLFDLPLAWVHEQFPEWGTRSQKGHVWSLCFGLLGLLSVWRLTARIGGERAGFWALLLLATLPRYYGHMFFNPKDIPLAGCYAFGVWSLVALFSRLPRPQWKWVLWVGAAAGMAMACRVAGFLVLVYFGGFVGLYLICEYARRQRDLVSIPKDLVYWALRGAAAGLVGMAILFVFWPTMHGNPFDAAGASVESAQNFRWDGFVLMDGFFWKAQDLPVYYLPYWIAMTTPAHVLALILGGLLASILRLYSGVRSGDWANVSAIFPRAVLVFSGLFPLVYILWKDPVLYDGLRHILFALPPLVGLAALTFEDVLRWGEKRGRVLAPMLQLGGLLAVGIVIFNMWCLHPYQYVYFNSVSGGLASAYNRDETDYWGLSHKEAGEWLNEYIQETDPDSGRVYHVHQRYSRWMLKEALDPERFEMWQPREGADFFVSVTRFNMHNSYPEAELLHIVERQGVPLCFIYSFDAALAE